jgi:hypothetical protein
MPLQQIIGRIKEGEMSGRKIGELESGRFMQYSFRAGKWEE